MNQHATNLSPESTQFVVKVGGRVIGKASSRSAADHLVNSLPETERILAEIVTVAANGNQLLLG